MNETWSATVRYLSRYRSALLTGVGTAACVALTLDPRTSVASSSIRFAFWFAMASTLLAITLTAVLSIAEYRSSRPMVPRAVARKPRR